MGQFFRGKKLKTSEKVYSLERKPKHTPIFLKLSREEKWFSKNVTYKQRVNRNNDV